jgi:type IV pilus assembly protein PilP
MSSAKTLIIGILLMAAGAAHTRAQVTPASGSGGQAAPPQAAKASPQAGKKPSAKPSTQTSAKPAVKKPVVAPTRTPSAPAAGEGEQKVARRDPFESLVGREQAAAAAAKNLPPGKAGLQVSTLRLDGIVKGPNGMIAVVSSPQSRTYFLREGDQLYDGKVEKIAMDSVSFHEAGKDAFGKPIERQVNKRIYGSAGEQQ